MAVEITMPKVGMHETDLLLAVWRVKEGDVIKLGDIIADLESDKTSAELEAFEEGTLLKIIVEEGESVPIGTVVAIVGEAGEDISGMV